MTTAVRLRVTGVDLHSEATNDLIARYFPDYSWASVDGQVTVTIFVPGGDVVGHVVEAANEIKNRLPDAKITRVHRDFVTMSDVAARVGLSREAIRKWTHRKGDDAFPAPVDTVGGPPSGAVKIWDWAEVVPWLEKVYGLAMDENLPDHLTIAHIDACLANVRDFLDRDWQQVGSQTARGARVALLAPRTSIMSTVIFGFAQEDLSVGKCSLRDPFDWTPSPAAWRSRDYV
ncbi:helix-turn-helix transcriptional regulator [Ornithinimicrobium pratense]|uniref:Helix-turn-helix domain-containing protein n=1 Tax=Ornithinimicrobium pratense TaxID=2593973 RepID=A0A5J6V8S8_9MICO|nr:hypothetical protein [Ornithinimicrobium pratense]QFG69511.1 hypothetical protein FY030_13080 [Ornithinimicrobium pratense]